MRGGQHDVTWLRDLCTIKDALWKLNPGSIERVERVENNTTKAAQFRGPYTERQTPYMIVLKGNKRLRRVFATPIGNVSVFYIKVYNRTVGNGVVYCESALDEALNRAEDD